MAKLKIDELHRILVKLPARTAVLLKGDHGIGKSDAVRQVATLLSTPERPYRFIDCRLSQMQEGDILGLPRLEDDRTVWCHPAWYVTACEEPTILHFDELNRGNEGVTNAVFQIVLDRILNGRPLHPDTRVFASVNDRSIYNVHPIDPALLNRFWVVDLVVDVDVWLAWAEREGLPSEVISWIRAHPDMLTPPKDFDPETQHPTPRSVTGMARAMAPLLRAPKVDRPTVLTIACGYIGDVGAASFISHLAQPISFTGFDVLERWPIIRRLFAPGRIDVLNRAMDLVTEELTTQYAQLGQRKGDPIVDRELAQIHGKNITAFLNDCPAELRPRFFQELAKGREASIPLVSSAWEYYVGPICDAFGVQVGSTSGRPSAVITGNG